MEYTKIPHLSFSRALLHIAVCILEIMGLNSYDKSVATLDTINYSFFVPKSYNEKNV